MPDLNHDLRIALLQSRLAWQDPLANREHFAAQLAGLPAGTDLAVLPEMFTTGFTMDAQGQAEAADGPTQRWLAEQAAATGVTLCGSLIVRDRGRCHNRLVWMPPDGAAGHYDKRHLFRMAGEHEHYSAGQSRRVFTLRGWRVCPLICYDLRFPVWSRGRDDYELLLYVANWPAARRSAWNTLLPARAVENLCYAAGVNRTGRDGNGVDYAGDSAVYDFFGDALARADDAPCVLHTTLDAARLSRYREKFPAHLDADDFTLG